MTDKQKPSSAYLDLIGLDYDDTGIGEAYAQREKERHAMETGGWFTCPKTGDRVRYHTRTTTAQKAARR